MFGKLNLAEFEALEGGPQDVASCLSAIDTWQDDLTGAEYAPILYVGTRITRGVNHVFLCEQTLLTYPLVRRLVFIEVNEYGNKFNVVPTSITEVA